MIDQDVIERTLSVALGTGAEFAEVYAEDKRNTAVALDDGRIHPVLPSTVREIRSESVLLDRDGEELELVNDEVFVLIGGLPPFEMLREMGIRFGDEA